MNSEKTSINNKNRFKSFLGDVVEAIAGTEQDFTDGRLSRAILLIAWLVFRRGRGKWKLKEV
ncbi:MAG: hypothetical protein ABR927_14730 [Bacteroidales bacterium]|jgi:hypothetical protein